VKNFSTLGGRGATTRLRGRMPQWRPVAHQRTSSGRVRCRSCSNEIAFVEVRVMGNGTGDTNRVFERYQTEMTRLQSEEQCQHCLDRQRAADRDTRSSL